jgi:hypothetical protein
MDLLANYTIHFEDVRLRADCEADQALSNFLAETQRRRGAEENVFFEGAEGALRAGGNCAFAEDFGL